MFVLDDGARLVVPRTELAYPAHNERFHKNAADREKSPVDAVVIDFEDACPLEHKGDSSRRIAIQALNTLDFGEKVITLRPNEIRSPFFLGDLEALILNAPDRFHGIVLPKTQSAEDIGLLARTLDDLERRGGWKHRIQIEALIETPIALLRAYEIATASERMAGLILGIVDFAASLGIRDVVEDQNLNFLYAKQSLIVAAKAAGLHAMDGVYVRLSRSTDPEERTREIEAGLREKNRAAAAMGMDGTWIVHPQQARIANECFTPTAEELTHARRVVEIYRGKGGGAIADPESGEMIDEASIKVALMDLAKGVQNGDVDPAYLAEQVARSRETSGVEI